MGEAPASVPGTTPVMRVGLGTLLGAVTLLGAGPVVLLIGVILGLGLFVGAAIALAHTGGLTEASFVLAHGLGLGGLGVFLISAYTYRFTVAKPRTVLGSFLRRPLLSAAMLLTAATVLLVPATWDTRGLGSLVAHAVVIDDFYFFTIGAFVLMAVATVLVARRVYRWASTHRYRAGLTTGVLVAMLGVLLVSEHHGASPALEDGRASSALRGRLPPAPPTASLLEFERELLAVADGWLETRRVPALEGPSTPMLPAATPTSWTDDDIVAACVRELTDPKQIEQVRKSLSKYALRDGDLHDVIYDAMMNVCEAHAHKAYFKLGAVLQTAADRRARRWRRRQGRECPISFEPPSCLPSADELVRFEREDRVINDAVCQESDVTQQVIWMRAIEEKDFATIAQLLGITERQARDLWSNARSRLRKRLADLCP